MNISAQQWNQLIGRVNNMERINGTQTTEIDALKKQVLALSKLVRYIYPASIGPVSNHIGSAEAQQYAALLAELPTG